MCTACCPWFLFFPAAVSLDIFRMIKSIFWNANKFFTPKTDNWDNQRVFKRKVKRTKIKLQVIVWRLKKVWAQLPHHAIMQRMTSSGKCAVLQSAHNNTCLLLLGFMLTVYTCVQSTHSACHQPFASNVFVIIKRNICINYTACSSCRLPVLMQKATISNCARTDTAYHKPNALYCEYRM